MEQKKLIDLSRQHTTMISQFPGSLWAAMLGRTVVPITVVTSARTDSAFTSGQVVVRLWNPRDYAQGGYRRVDDRPFGGGPGMVMMAEPLRLCLQAIRADRGQSREQAPLLLFSPVGPTLQHDRVAQLAAGDGAVLLCGRYEGIDQRFIDRYVDGQISLGDFVLSGGEIAALAVLDAVTRLLPGALGDAESAQDESFSHGLLEYPHYTRPAEFRGMKVPDVLLSGNHAEIEKWRREQALQRTRERRPDLLK